MTNTEYQRKRSVLRINGGGGEDDNINWVLARNYQLLVKVKNWRRAGKLCTTVTRWYSDPKVPGRELGWVEEPYAYMKPTRQLALRTLKKNGIWNEHALVFTLTDAMLFQLRDQVMPTVLSSADVLFAVMHAYDRRGGGVETQNKGDMTSKVWDYLSVTNIRLRLKRLWCCWPN